MTQAILLKDVKDLGDAGTVVDVASGYLRNFLVPHGLAQPATDAAIVEARRRMEVAERTNQQRVERSQESVALLNKTVLTISHQAGEDGRLFGSVTAQEIVKAIRDARNLNIEKKMVLLKEPIKRVGTHMIDIEIGPGAMASIKTIVVAES